MTHEAYFARLSTNMQTLDAEVGEVDATVTARSSLADDSVPRLEHSLRSLAASLDELHAPSDTSSAHHDLRAATLDLADLLRDAVTQPAADRTSRGATFTSNWINACHTLQDIALANKIDADLRCATALRNR